jgi:hypothetical protein
LPIIPTAPLHHGREAGPAQIDPHPREAVTGEVAVHRLVALARPLALAVGQVLEDRRDGPPLGAGGEPEPRGEPAAVRERDPAVLDLAKLARQRLDRAHEGPSGGTASP